MRIIVLPSGSATNDDVIAIDNSTNGTRKLGLETYIDGKIDVDSLTAATAVDDTDVYRIKRSTSWMKMTWATIKSAINTLIAGERPIHLSSSVTSLPKTISDAKITADHRVVDMKITGATTSYVLAWTTAAGSVTFSLSSGTFSNSTFDFDLEITQ